MWKHYLKMPNPVSKALDRVQGANINLSDAVKIFRRLSKYLSDFFIYIENEIFC